MNSKISEKDKKTWDEFLSSDQKLYDKDKSELLEGLNLAEYFITSNAKRVKNDKEEENIKAANNNTIKK